MIRLRSGTIFTKEGGYMVTVVGFNVPKARLSIFEAEQLQQELSAAIAEIKQLQINENKENEK